MREEERETERASPSLSEERALTGAVLLRADVAAVLLFVILRTIGAFESTAATVARLYFLSVTIAAFVASAYAVRSARGGPGAWTWSLLAAALAALALGGVWLNAQRLFGRADVLVVPSLFDGANISAAALLLAAAASRVAFATTEPSVRIRRAADVAGTLVVVFGVAYAVFSRMLDTPTADVVWSSFYMAAGFGVIAAAIMLAVGFRRTPWSGWERSFVAALGVYGWVLLCYPVWHRAAATPTLEFVEVLVEASLLTAHVLLVASAATFTVAQYRGTAPVWTSRWTGLPSSTSISLIVSSVSVVAVPLFGLAALSAPRGSSDSIVYVALAAMSCAAVVARTSIAGLETGLLRASVSRDVLTGVLDRGAARATIIECERTAVRYGERFSVIVFDLDDFGVVNTLYGPEEGDRLIARAAEAVSAAIRPDVLGRLGGDEFVAVLSEADRMMAARTAEEMRAALAGVHTSSGLALTASWGTATYPDDADSVDVLMMRADSAQYWAKHHGKDRVVQYEASSLGVLDEVSRFIREQETDEYAMLVAVSRMCHESIEGHRHHARNVAALAVLVARRLGLDGPDIRDIELAALVHDIGMIAIGADTDAPPGARCAGTNRCHPPIGASILASTSFSRLAPVVRAHHERWDGSGHPDGLAGAQIPLATRIISVCDALERLTAGDRGRGPLSRPAALHELDQQMGTAFDPEVTEALIEVVGDSVVLGWEEEQVW